MFPRFVCYLNRPYTDVRNFKNNMKNQHRTLTTIGFAWGWFAIGVMWLKKEPKPCQK